jgi:hypothetical protein
MLDERQAYVLPKKLRGVIIRLVGSRDLFHLIGSSLLPITVAARSKAWTVFARSNTVTWVRISLEAWMIVFVLFCAGSGLATGWSPS